MTKRYLVVLMLAGFSFAAHAAENVSAPVKPAHAVQTAVAAPVKAPISQQDKMRECNKQATGKKGAERKAFMKTCLSRKV